jgi:hypothetical protein
MMRWMLTVSFIVAAGVVLAVLQFTTPTYAYLTGPIEIDGVQGKPVARGPFKIEIDRVLLADTLVFKRFGKPIERQTDGVWVIVQGVAGARHISKHIGYAALKGASGRIYVQTNRADGPQYLMKTRNLEPGLTSHGIFVFEVAKGETRDMTLLLSETPGPQLDTQLHIALSQDGIERRDRLEVRDDGI